MLEHLVEGGTIQNLILDDCTLGIKSQTVLLPWLGEGACPLRSLSVRRCGLQLLSSGRHCGFERLLQAVCRRLGSSPGTARAVEATQLPS